MNFFDRTFFAHTHLTHTHSLSHDDEDEFGTFDGELHELKSLAKLASSVKQNITLHTNIYHLYILFYNNKYFMKLKIISHIR